MPDDHIPESVGGQLRRAVAPGVEEFPGGANHAPTERFVPSGAAWNGDAAWSSDAAGTSDAAGGNGAAGADGAAGAPDRPVRRLPGPDPFDPGRRGVRALTVAVALAVVAAAVVAWYARPEAEPVSGADTLPAALATPVPDTVTGRGVDSSATRGGEVVVAVTGKVRRPGLVRLPAGARVADAVEAAGGLLPGADVAFLNVARKVVDGELILVGVTAPPGVPGQPAVPPGGTGAAAGAAGLPVGPVNLNTATATQLDTLPGVGPVLAQRIIDHRDRHGAFRSVADLRQVDGIGDARYERLKDLVTV